MAPTVTESPPTRIIDPKFRDRRIAVLREKGRRRLRVLLALVVAATLLGGAYLATESALLDVDRITVIGAEHTSAAVVAGAAHVRRGAPLIWTDRGAIARRVQSLPWVASAHVGIKLPGELRIRVVERVAVAYAARADGAFALLDHGGRILQVVATRPGGVPEIVGAGPPPEPGRTLDAAHAGLVLVSALGADLAKRSASIDVTSGVVDHLSGAGEVRFGSLDQIAGKVAALHAVLDNLAGKPFAYIDVRVPDAPVVGS